MGHTYQHVGGTATAEAPGGTSTACESRSQFVGPLFNLDLEMVSMQSGIDAGAGAGTGEGVLNVSGDILGSDPYSADVGALLYVHLSFRERTRQRSSDFSTSRLGGVSALDIERLMYWPSDVSWDTITAHLLFRFSSSHSAAIHPPTSSPRSR